MGPAKYQNYHIIQRGKTVIFFISKNIMEEISI